MSDKGTHDQHVFRLTRRKALKGLAAGLGSLAIPGKDASASFWEAFFQKNFRELSRPERDRLLARLEKEVQRPFGKAVKVKASPVEGVCSGTAGPVPMHRLPQVRVRMRDREQPVPTPRSIGSGCSAWRRKGALTWSMPSITARRMCPRKAILYARQCHQCENAPCTRLPGQATLEGKRQDRRRGLQLVHRVPVLHGGCPYGARHFNWKKPGLPAGEMNPDTHYLGNRPRPVGVVEKCTFCIQRTRELEGRYPACVEVCPVGARKFGNLLDPDSEIRYVIENKRVFILKEELNTQPKFYYFYSV
jgi:molybdopterin-containing oxidoreductase family iron-sulfur binding subunit